MSTLVVVSLACNLDIPQGNAPQPAVPTIVPASPIPLPTVEVQEEEHGIFDAANSGTICPKDSTPLDTGGPPSYIGEKDGWLECAGFWSFTIQRIPSAAQVLSAVFSPGVCVESGSPFMYGGLIFGFLDYETLDVNDYGRGGDAWTPEFSVCPQTIDMTAYVISRARQHATSIQIIARMSVGNYGDDIDDYISFRTGSVPTLVIQYKYYK